MPINPILNLSHFTIKDLTPDFYCNLFSDHLNQNHSKITVPHKHDFYLCVLFTAGYGTHQIDFNSYPIQPGSVFCLSPGQIHNWRFKGAVEGYIFFHSASFYEAQYTRKALTNFPFFLSNLNSSQINLTPKAIKRIVPLFKRLLESYQSNHVMKSHKICSLIDLIYIELYQEIVEKNLPTTPQSKAYGNTLHQLEQLIEQYYLTNKSPQFYADQLNITTKHLNRISKELINKTTSTLILERVILEAKRLLTHSRKNYSEIARYLGYDDYAYFSRLFKQKSGYSPSKFEKEVLKK
ncbi:MAG: AraC family transcriptional regulator [Flavobacteriales bacterium]|jgi:AraC-like DNA-binding protein|nr:AraC family transcriptional regulator [Flavobacteriales bacterium]